MEKLCYHRNPIEASGGVFASVIVMVYLPVLLWWCSCQCYCGGVVASVMAKIRSGWSKFKDLVSLLASKCLLSERKADCIPTFVGSVMLYCSDTWASKEEDECSM